MRISVGIVHLAIYQSRKFKKKSDKSVLEMQNFNWSIKWVKI